MIQLISSSSNFLGKPPSLIVVFHPQYNFKSYRTFRNHIKVHETAVSAFYSPSLVTLLPSRHIYRWTCDFSIIFTPAHTPSPISAFFFEDVNQRSIFTPLRIHSIFPSFFFIYRTMNDYCCCCCCCCCCGGILKSFILVEVRFQRSRAFRSEFFAVECFVDASLYLLCVCVLSRT